MKRIVISVVFLCLFIPMSVWVYRIVVPPATLDEVSQMASKATLWRVLVHTGLGNDYQYEISDPVVFQKLSQLMTSQDEIVYHDTAITLAPYVYIDLVHDKTGSSTTKVEVGGDVFYANLSRHRYMVLLKSHELYQRLVDKNFEFHKPFELWDSDRWKKTKP